MLKYLSVIAIASSLEISSELGPTSRQSSVQGDETSIPRVATESKKHEARSEEASDGTCGMVEFDRIFDPELMERGVR